MVDDILNILGIGNSEESTPERAVRAPARMSKAGARKARKTVKAARKQFNRIRGVRKGDLRELLVREMQDLYSAEDQIIRALPMMIKSAKSQRLKVALRSHLLETKKQKSRLEKGLRKLNARPGRETCEAMKGLLKEGDHMMNEKAMAPVKDAGLIGAAQKVEHYEIASYGTAAEFAKLLKEREVQRMLAQTLKEEERANEKLNKIAMGDVNRRALEA